MSLYLTDIVEATDHIAEFIAGADFQAFQKSELLRSAVVQKLAIIGGRASLGGPQDPPPPSALATDRSLP
jgi:uncharacterized protein with HEPN domain